jgi:outer membrane receptor protein involved in Fe transport
MKKIFSSLVAIAVSITMMAQFPGGAQGNRAAGVTGRFYGKIVDSITKKPIDAASIQLYQNKLDTVTKKRKEVIVGGMLTQANGDFSLENVPLMGQYKLIISAIGFKPYSQPLAFFDMKAMQGGKVDMASVMNKLDKDLGNISLQIDEKVLGTVVVSASKPLLQLGIDRKIFNVDKNIVSAGGTAVDIMRNVPSLNVDIDGNVSLRNNAPQIFVDGRPTTLTLEQIPADAIESVEIITNPSAKFDASGGTAGILNIVLKKNKKVGYNGGIRASVDSRGKVGGGADINLRQNKINFFASGNYNQRKSISEGTTERLTYGNPDTRLYQKDNSTMLGNFGFGRGGFDYFIDNRNTFTLSGTYVKGKFQPNTGSTLLIDSLFNPKTSSYSERFSNTTGQFKNVGTSASYKHNFVKAGREITADATYNKSTNNNSNFIRNDYFDNANNITRSFRQQQLGSGNNSNLVIQSDFINPISENSKFEAGVRASIRKVNSSNNFYFVDPSTGNPIFNQELSIKYESTDEVYAGYATFSNKIKDFGYQLGLRVENSNYVGKMPDKGDEFTINFPISLFPSVFLSQQLKNDQELQLNYSRRINRPNFWQLSPFTDYSDSLNLSRGNPNLKPEFTNSIEVSYAKTFKNKDNFLASVYFKNTNDLITRFQAKELNPYNSKEVLVNTYINANASYVTGLELTGKNKITKWWDVTSNLNLYTAEIKVDDPSIQKQDQFVSYFAKLNNSFKLPKSISVQLSADYQSKTISPQGGGGGRGMFGGGSQSTSQGFIRPNFGVDAAVKFDFLAKKNASVSLNVNDIFKTREYDSHAESAYFLQDVTRIRDAQIFRLNLSWRFGKFDAALFKRKNMKGERESMQGANEGTNL